FRGVINHHDIILKHSDQKEDVENTIRSYIRDGGVLRYNYVTVKTKWYAPGGIVSQTAGGSKSTRIKLSKDAVDLLNQEFPTYGKIKQRSNGIYEFVLHKKPKLTPKLRTKDLGFTDTSIYQPPLRNIPKINELKEILLNQLRKITIPPIPKPRSGREISLGNKLGNIGRTMTMGYGDTRKGIKQYAINKKYPDLLKALIEFGNNIVPVGFEYSSITINHGVKANKHIDKVNGGISYIIGIGDFTGGNLIIWDKDGETYQEYNLNEKPIGFNGKLLYHQTTPFEGERYTIIYYKQRWEGNIDGYVTKGIDI
ncbi:MAG: hypothetical protein ACR2HS_03890, partial [Gammaproteobacteria bacterium]